MLEWPSWYIMLLWFDENMYTSMVENDAFKRGSFKTFEVLVPRHDIALAWRWDNAMVDLFLIFMLEIWLQIGYTLCSKCKVFKCVTFPNYSDGADLSSWAYKFLWFARMVLWFNGTTLSSLLSGSHPPSLCFPHSRRLYVGNRVTDWQSKWKGIVEFKPLFLFFGMLRVNCHWKVERLCSRYRL